MGVMANHCKKHLIKKTKQTRSVMCWEMQVLLYILYGVCYRYPLENKDDLCRCMCYCTYTVVYIYCYLLENKDDLCRCMCYCTYSVHLLLSLREQRRSVLVHVLKCQCAVCTVHIYSYPLENKDDL